MRRLLLMALTIGLIASATPAVAKSAPLTGNPRSANGALARGTALAASLRLPQDLAWTTKATRLTARGDVQATQTVVPRRRAQGTQGAAGLVEFLRAHPPSGMVFSFGDFSAAGGSVGYRTKATTDTSAELQYTVRGKNVLLLLYVTVGWTPARPADTLLPSGLKRVTVEVWPTHSYGGQPSFKHQVIHASGPAVAPLGHYLNGLAVQGPDPFGAGACATPLFYDSQPRF